jgi:hypothetical protein
MVIDEVSYRSSVRFTHHHPNMKRVLFFRAMALAVFTHGLVQHGRAADQTAIWDNSSNVWTAPGHWSTALFPNNGNGGFTYDAVVGGGTVTLDQNITILRYTQSAGTLTGVNPFTLTVNEVFTWSGGTLTGAGITQANGGITLNGASRSLNGGTLNNAGTANWTAGDFDSGNGAIFNNRPGATFNTTFGGTFSYNQGGAVTQFNNEGTFNKNTSVSTTAFTTVFHNSGAVNINVGTLSLSGGGTHAGAFNIANGATLNFSNGAHDLNAGSMLTGPGTVQVGGGTMNFNAGSFTPAGTTVSGGTANFNAAAANTVALTVSGGTLGGTGTITAGGLFTWSGGTLTGAGVTQANGGITLNGASRSLNGRTLNNAGTANWTAGDFDSGNGAIFNNRPGATFNTTFGGSTTPGPSTRTPV